MGRAKSPPWEALLRSFPDSRKINSVSEGAELLYLRLIAVSDDAGRYYAEPAVLHARVFTFRARDVSVPDVARRRDELVRAGLIEVYRVEGEDVLQVVGIYRRLRPDVEAKIAFPGPERGVRAEPVTEAARVRPDDVPLDPDPDPDETQTQKPPQPPTGGGAPSKQQPKPRFDPTAELPTDSSPELVDAWAEWVACRREAGKALKPTTTKAQLRHLAEWGPEDFIESLRQSIAAGWTGLFPPKPQERSHAQARPFASQRRSTERPEDRGEPPRPVKLI